MGYHAYQPTYACSVDRVSYECWGGPRFETLNPIWSGGSIFLQTIQIW